MSDTWVPVAAPVKPTPNMSETRSYFRSIFDQMEKQANAGGGEAPKPLIKPADDHAEFVQSVAASLDQYGGFLPTPVLGGVSGELINSRPPQQPPEGYVLPMPLRAALMNHYAAQDFTNFKEYFGAAAGEIFGLRSPSRAELAKERADAENPVIAAVIKGFGTEPIGPSAADEDAAARMGLLYKPGVSSPYNYGARLLDIPTRVVADTAEIFTRAFSAAEAGAAATAELWAKRLGLPDPKGLGRAAATLLESEGARTMAEGGVKPARPAPEVLGRAPVPPSLAAADDVAIATNTGTAIQAAVPDAAHFTDAAAVMTQGAEIEVVAARLRDAYIDTGVPPAEIAAEAAHDPALLQRVVAGPAEPPRLPPPREPPVEATAPEPERSGLTEAENAIAATIGEPADRARVGLNFDKLYTATVEELHPVKVLTDALADGKPLPPTKDPFVQFRLGRGDIGKADHMLTFATFDPKTLKNTGPGLRDILRPVRDEIPRFEIYMTARRVVELERRGVETGKPLTEAEKVVRDGYKEFADTFDQYQAFNKRMLDYLQKSGNFSKEQIAKIAEGNASYVPFNRLMEDGFTGQAGGSPGLPVRNPIKRIKGSSRKTLSPLQNTIRNVYAIVRAAERNRALNTLIDLAEGSPHGAELVQKVRTETRPITISDAEVGKLLEQHGMSVEDAEAFTIFRPTALKLAKDEIAVYRDGKLEVYRVPEEVAQAIVGLDDFGVHGYGTAFMAKFSKLLRAGTTLNPTFIVKNFTRDQWSAFIQSQEGQPFMPVAGFIDGIGTLLMHSEDYATWLKSGAMNATYSQLDHQYIRNQVRILSGKDDWVNRAWNVLTPLELLAQLSRGTEMGTRVGVFKAGMRGELRPGETYADQVQRAGMGSREATVDFGRRGAQMKALNHIISFLNPSIQGPDMMARSFAEFPAATILKALTSITLGTIILWWYNKDDPKIAAMPNWERDLYWNFSLDDGTVGRLPKDFQYGLVFGSAVERTLDAFYKHDPNAFEGFDKSIRDSIAPGFLPQFMLPLLEQKTNYSFFHGGPLVPERLKAVLPEYQYTEYTSETAKALGRMIAMVPGGKDSSAASPSVLENYVREWTGGLGLYMLKIADAGLIASGAVPKPNKPETTLADVPGIQAFIARHPSASTRDIERFYDSYELNAKTIATIQMQAREGNADAAVRELVLTQNSTELLKLQGIQQTISEQNTVIRFISGNKDITPAEQRQLIDGLYIKMNELAKLGNLVLDKLQYAMDHPMMHPQQSAQPTDQWVPVQ